MKQEVAETIGLRALAWIAGNEEVLPVFLGSTGAGVDDLKNRAQDPDFMISLLDFLMMDDAWVQAFCDHAELPYDAPMSARAALPGGAEVNWT